MKTRLDIYLAVLRTHDWHHERNDTCRYMQCRAERRWLEQQQPIVDPQHALWNEHAPHEFKRAEATA
jgi:hypothetical protein